MSWVTDRNPTKEELKPWTVVPGSYRGKFLVFSGSIHEEHFYITPERPSGYWGAAYVLAWRPMLEYPELKRAYEPTFRNPNGYKPLPGS